MNELTIRLGPSLDGEAIPGLIAALLDAGNGFWCELCNNTGFEAVHPVAWAANVALERVTGENQGAFSHQDAAYPDRRKTAWSRWSEWAHGKAGK